MQRRNIYMSIVIAVAMAAGASAQNNIVSFGGGVSGTDYEIVDASGIITIYNADGIAYAFWAEDSGGGPGTGLINEINLDDPNSMTGDFSLLIADPNHPADPNYAGALHWRGGPRIACDRWGRDFSGKRVGLTE